MYGGVVGRHCNIDSILAIPIHNNQEVIKYRSCGELCDLRKGKEVYADVCRAGLMDWHRVEVPTWLLYVLID